MTENIEEWARDFAALAGVEFVPLVQWDDMGDGTVRVRYLFERIHKLEASQVAMRLVMHKYRVQVFLHAENWLTVEVTMPEDTFTKPAPTMYYRHLEGAEGAMSAEEQEAEARAAVEAAGLEMIEPDEQEKPEGKKCADCGTGLPANSTHTECRHCRKCVDLACTATHGQRNKQ
ncbi:hypothetical protein [Streptomyces sp. NPDC058861]|uniref:hypothetical protein n=1 Tax=Streptomyces sp. NPDC058861 TaxID=3346653 RepID=UPI0036BAFFF0